MVGVRRVVFYACDIRSVRVAFLKRDADFRSRQQRQMQAVGVSRIRARLAYPQALITRFPRIAVKIEVDPVAPVFVYMGINIVFTVLVTRAGSVPAITGWGISAGR